MPTDPIAQLTSKWNNRFSQLQSAGMDTSRVQHIAQTDIAKVKSGGSAMTDQEAALAVAAAYRNNTAIGNPQRGTKPTDIIGNIPKDIFDIGKGAVFGIPNFLHHLPSEVTNTVKAAEGDQQTFQKLGLEHFTGSIPHDFLAALRNIHKTPIGGLVPVVGTLGNLGTSEGRKELERHPVSTVLDVLPVAAKGAEILGETGRVAEAAAAAKAASESELAAGEGEAAAKLAAKSRRLSAVQDALTHEDTYGRTRPQVGKALIRSIPGANDRLTALAESMNIDKASAELNKLRSYLSRGVSLSTQKYHQDLTKDPILGKYTSEQGIVEATQAVMFKKDAELTPEEVVLKDRLTYVNADTATQHLADGGSLAEITLPDGTKEIYSLEGAGGQLVEAQKKIMRNGDREGKFVNQLQFYQDRHNKLIERVFGTKKKVRGFLESEADFAKREGDKYLLPEIKSGTRDIFTVMKDDPLRILGPVSGKITKPLKRDFARIVGEDGLFAQFNKHLENGDVISARKALTEVRGILRHKGMQKMPYAEELRRFANDVDGALRTVRGDTKQYNSLMKQIQRSTLKLRKHEKALTDLMSKNVRDKAAFEELVAKSPPRRYHALIAKNVWQRLEDQTIASGKYSVAELPQILDKIRSGVYSHVISGDDFEKLIDEAAGTWQDLKSEGFNPVYIHSVNPGKIDSLTRRAIHTEKILEPGYLKEAVLNLHETVANFQVALTDMEAQRLMEKASERFAKEGVLPHVKTYSELEQAAYEALKSGRVKLTMGRTAKNYIADYIKTHYDIYNPESFGVSRATLGLADESYYLPKNIGKAISSFYTDGQLGKLRKGYMGAMRVYKFSVLTGPRHIVHATMSGLMFQMFEDPRIVAGPGALTRFKQAVAFARHHGEGMPVEISRQLEQYQIGEVAAVAKGKTLGRLFNASLKARNAIFSVEDFIGNMEKSMTYLYGETRAARDGLSEQAAREAGLRLANKIHIDMDSMTPFERQTIRNVFPFYAFQKQLLKILFTYPSDHPFRASILSKIAEQQMQEIHDGLPGQFQQYFFFGDPKKASQLIGIDMKSLNPFRSVGDNFTLTGFASQVNPIISAVERGFGIDPIKGTPEMYPDMTYNAFTGKEETKRPSGFWHDVLYSFIPQTETVSNMFDQANAIRRAPQQNRFSKLHDALQILNFPFAPSVIRPGEIQGNAEIARYKVAQTELSKALRTGDFSTVKHFALVPYQSGMYTPDQMAQYYKAIHGKLPKGISVKTVLPKGRRRAKPNIISMIEGKF